eukprot:Clim_evm15s210 gene=Clim_evmTU15s210
MDPAYARKLSGGGPSSPLRKGTSPMKQNRTPVRSTTNYSASNSISVGSVTSHSEFGGIKRSDKLIPIDATAPTRRVPAGTGQSPNRQGSRTPTRNAQQPFSPTRSIGRRRTLSMQMGFTGSDNLDSRNSPMRASPARVSDRFVPSRSANSQRRLVFDNVLSSKSMDVDVMSNSRSSRNVGSSNHNRNDSNNNTEGGTQQDGSNQQNNANAARSAAQSEATYRQILRNELLGPESESSLRNYRSQTSHLRQGYGFDAFADENIRPGMNADTEMEGDADNNGSNSHSHNGMTMDVVTGEHRPAPDPVIGGGGAAGPHGATNDGTAGQRRTHSGSRRDGNFHMSPLVTPRQNLLSFDDGLGDEPLNHSASLGRQNMSADAGSQNMPHSGHISPLRMTGNMGSHAGTSQYSLSPLTTASQQLLTSPVRQTRNVPKQPFKVLDAPDLQDDFYLNLVDWSQSNILAVGLGPCVYLWNAGSGMVTRLCDLSPDDNFVTSVSWSPKSDYIAVGTNRSEVQLWDVETQTQIRTLSGHSARVGSLAWSSSLLSSGSRDRSICQRDIRAVEHFTTRLTAHKQEVCGLKWSPDETLLASGGNDNKLLIWSSRGGHAARSSLNRRSSNQPIMRFSDHVAAVKAIAWSPHQHGLLVSGGGTADKCIRFWNTLTNQSLQVVDTGSQVCNLAWSKSVNELVSTHGYSQNQICLWKYPSMVPIATLMGHSYRVLYLAMSPDGQTIVTGAGDETLRFWNVFAKEHERSGRKSVLNILGQLR